MKTIVVYYSMEGNTDFVAQSIAEATGADTLRIYPKKGYPTAGARKFIWGGASAVMARTPALEPYDFDAAAYDRVIIGFPVWAGTFAPPIRTFVKENDVSGKQVAAFACQAGNGGEKALAKLKELIGVEGLEAEMVLVDPKEKPTEENAGAIARFCASLGE